MTGPSEDMEQLEPSHSADENIKGQTPFGKLWQFLKANCTLNHPTPRYLPKRKENKTYSHKELYSTVASSFVHESPKLETTQRLSTGE